ncbi:MAG: uracil-DNA glycosylase [Candidatus Bathyarchaeota archaeon]|nr:uracil-DNA glycosylase [Candidatus Bathyarchaeota archaeon]
MSSMDELNFAIYGCKKCRLWQDAKHGVPGEGPINAKIMFVGQNPGVEEDEVGRPFVGKTGKYLTKVLAENGLSREDLFITNIVKHKTPKNRKPFADEVAACLPYLLEQIRIIKPEKVVLMGKTAWLTPRFNGIKYYEVVHPQAASRFPKMGKKFQEQIKAIMR